MREEVVQAIWQVIGIVLTLGATALGIWAKNLAKKWVNNDTKRQIAENVVLMVEQVYKTLHGEEKLAQAMVLFSEQLAEKNIYITDSEMKLLLEATVAKFNDAFHKDDTEEDETDTETGE